MVFCDNCGHTLKPTSKFCAKCGTKIDEMPEKEKPSISQEDFFKKYHGDKILDRISEILKSSEIGDEDILFSISKKLKKKKEIDADDIQYLMDCSEELDEKEAEEYGYEQPTNKKKISRIESTLLGDDPSSPLYTKGTSGFYGKRNVGKRKTMIAILGAVMFILIVGTIMLGNELGSERPPAGYPSEAVNREQQEALKVYSEFDPLVVAEAKKNIPAMQNLAELVLEKCRGVNSYSDYLVFVTVITSKSERLLENLNGVDEVLTILEVGGYDEHHEVGPLIKETRSSFGKAGNCMSDLTAIYGN